jgi:hypothetical protein
MSETAIDEYLPKTGTARAVIYLRTTAPTTGHSTQRDCLERLSKLEASGRLDSATVRVWGDSICTSAPELAGLDDILETITDLYAFSSERKVVLAPFFKVERIEATIPNEVFERIVPPHRTLVFTEGDDIVGVFPCRLGGQTYTPFDAIGHLEATADLDHVDAREITATPHR